MADARRLTSRAVGQGLGEVGPWRRTVRPARRALPERFALGMLAAVTVASLLGFAVFGRHPELIARYPGADRVYLVAFAVTSLFHGPISDAAGRRPVILFGTLCYTLASVVCALAPTMAWMLTGRALQGLCAGAGMIVGRTIVRDVFEGDAAQRTMFSSGEGEGRAPRGGGRPGSSACSSAGSGGWTGPPGGLSVIPSLVGMECCDRVAVGEVNQRGRPRRRCRGS